jgi:hypothetical protein
MWLGRLVPTVAWSFWLVAVLVPGFGPSESLGMGILFLIWLLSLVAYILWVYFLLPELLFEGTYRGFGLRVVYCLFTGVTAGLGPVVWYFLRVDRHCSAWQPHRRISMYESSGEQAASS